MRSTIVCVAIASIALAALFSADSVSGQGLCGGTLASPGVCGSPANNYVAPSAAAVSKLSKYTNIVHIYLTANSFDFLFGAYPGSNNIPNALNNGLYHPQLTEAGYVGQNSSTFPCLPCDTAGYITATSVPFNTSFCTAQALAGQVPGACIPNQPFEISQLIPTNVTWANDPKHTFYATQYNDNAGQMNGFVWGAGKAGEAALGYYNLTGQYIFELAQNYTLFDNFFQSAYGGVMINHLYMVSAQVAQWNSTASTAGPCPTSITQNYNVAGLWVNTTTTGLYASDYVDADGVFFPKNDASLFTPDCHVVENVSPFTLGASPNMPPLTIPHIGTLLNAAQVSWTYYYQDWDAVITTPLGTKTHQPVSYHENPFTFFNDFADVNSSYSQTHIKDDPNFYADLASGNLASVTWVKPDQTDGFGVTDNNPYLGQIKLKSYMDAIYASSYWKAGTMMVIVSFSDSDGLYDHVPPYTGDSYGPGGRVPTIVISPDTAGGQINSQPYETASWLRMLGTRFNVNASSLFMNEARLTSTNDFTNIFTDKTTYIPGAAGPSAASSSSGAVAPVGSSSSSSSSGTNGGGNANSANARSLSMGTLALLVALGTALLC